MKLTIYTDGGSRGNPGPAALGFVIYDEQGKEIFKAGHYLGVTTNNQAEYRAVLAAIEKAGHLGAKEVHFVLDSELIVKQMNHEYKVRDPDLAPLFLKIWNHLVGFRKVTFSHVPREKNKAADAMVNEALDQFLKRKT